MNTTELIRLPATFGEMVAEVIPLIGVVAGYGPAVILVAGPWLLLALMLSAPFAVLLTLVTGDERAAPLVPLGSTRVVA
jgi:hypothetical protein